MNKGTKYKSLKEVLERLLEGLLLPGEKEPVPVPIPVRNRNPHPGK